jgi:tetratricopeptide (TPR) repeat protein
VLAAAQGLSAGEIVTLLRVDQGKRWQRGERLPVEAYLEHLPGLRGEEQVLLGLIAGEVLAREARGESPSWEEYHGRFPQYHDLLRRVFALSEAGSSSAGDGPGSPGTLGPSALLPAGAAAVPPLPTPFVPPTRAPDTTAGDEEATLEGTTRPKGGANPKDSGPALPDYEILGKLGRGGMGIVYKALHRPLKRVVALKMVLAGQHAEPELLDRFRREAEAVARLQHPNVVQIYEIGEHGGLPFFSLEFVEGGSLDRRIRGAPQPARQAAELVETLARAMSAAHARGILHRDLKPGNVLVAADGTPKITDFGLAKQLDRQTVQTEAGRILGTPEYMAPEQAYGRIDEIGPLADVYALGVILYELLTGRVPFLGENPYDTLQQVCTHDPVSPRRLQPAVPRDLEKVCLKCLEKAPTKRYASAEALADDLRRFLDGKPVRARSLTPVGRALKWAGRNRAAAVTAFALVLAALGVVSGIVFRSLYQAQLNYDRAQESAHQAQESAYQAQQTAQQLAALQKQVNAHQEAIALWDKARDARAAGQWQTAWDQLVLALAKLDSEPGADAGERGRIEADKAAVGRTLAARASRQDLKDRKPRFDRHCRDVAFHQINGLLSDRGPDADRAAIRRDAAAALAEFGLSVRDTPAHAVTVLEGWRQAAELPRQIDEIAADCYQVLLTWAEAESPPGAGGQAGAREALRLLDLAAALGEAHHLPTPRAFHQRRARYLAVAGDKAAARAEEQRAAGMERHTALDFFLSALESYGQRKPAEAAAVCDRVLLLQPDHFWAQYLKALWHLRTKHWGEGKAELTVCLDRQPGFDWARTLRATAESYLGEFESAEEDFGRVLRGAEDRTVRWLAYTNRGTMWVLRERWAEAIADFEQAISQQPDTPETYANLAQVYRRRKDWKAALATLDQGLARHPRDDAVLYHTRAEVDLDRADFAAARQDLQEAIARTPPGAAPERLAADHVGLAHVQRVAEEHKASLASCEVALGLVPDFPPAHRQRAETFLAMGRYDEAGKALDHFLHTGKLTAKGYQVRGLIDAGLRQYAEAVEAYGRALALEQDANTLAYRGWAYLKLDAPRLALADFDAALRLAPAQTDALCGRGAARVRLGRLAEAVADAHAALQHGRPSPLLRCYAAYVYAGVVGQLEARAGGWPTPGGPATRYQERAVDLLRTALDDVPARQRREFWRANVQSAPDLAPIRHATGFIELARDYRP